MKRLIQGAVIAAVGAFVLLPNALPPRAPADRDGRPPAPTSLVPSAVAEEAGSDELSGESAAPASATERARAATEATVRISHAAATAREYAFLDRSARALEEAVAALRHHPADAITVARRVLEVPQPESVRQRALWIEGEARVALGEHALALAAFEAVGDTGLVEDYRSLRRIDALLALGRAAEAVDLARSLVASLEAAGPHTLHRAREVLVQSLDAAGEWQAFVDAGRGFLATYPEYPRRDQLLLRLGLAELELGRPQAAAEDFDRVIWEFPYRPFAAQAEAAMATAVEAGGVPPTHSINARYERIQGLAWNKHWALVDELLAEMIAEAEARADADFANELRLDRVRNAYGSGDFAAALTHLEEISAHDSVGVRFYTLQTWYSDVYARLGRHEEGIEALRRRDAGRSTVARHQELAEYYYDNGFYTEALAHYREVYSARRQEDWGFSLLLFLAGEYDQASRHFEALARGGGSERSKYRYWAARAHQEAGRTERAREQFRDIVDDYGSTYYGLQARNRLLELDREAVLVATAMPGGLAGALERAGEAVDAALGRGAVASAVGAGAPGAPGDQDDPRAPAPERRRVLGEADVEELAQSIVRDLNFTLTELVRRQLPDLPEWADAEDLRVNLPARIHWDGPDGVSDSHLAFLAADEPVVEAYLHTPDRLALVSLAENHGDLFPALRRAEFLDAVGQWHDAWWEGREAVLEYRALDALFSRRRPTEARPHEPTQRRYAFYIDNRSEETGYWGHALDLPRWPRPTDRAADRAWIERQLAIYDRRGVLDEAFTEGLMVLGDYHMVRRFARDRGGWSSSEPSGDRADDWSQAYPRAFPELVGEYSQEWEINPYVIWALMNVESSFNPDSISRANARGLLQVIPKTGELISQRLGYWDFGPSNLMNPELSIEFGCYYFSELMTKFHGQELIAFAAYNGGPHRISRLLEAHGRLPLDAFIETIHWDQAREYSKKVFRYLAIFRRLYFGDDTLYVGQAVDPEYELNVHF
jgi:tetratricopeptide (TPR) repeat protein